MNQLGDLALSRQNLATSSDDMVARQVHGLPNEPIAEYLLRVARDPRRTLAEKEREFRVVNDKVRAAHEEIKAQSLIQ